MVTDRYTVKKYCDCCGAGSDKHYADCLHYTTPWKTVDVNYAPNHSAKDAVNSPSHYTAGKVEVIDYIEQVCGHYPGDEAPHVANAIKYVSRAPLKGKKLEDLKKARWYLDRLISKLENN